MKQILLILTVLLTFLMLKANVSADSLNSFYITDFTINFNLGKDTENRSTLNTEEEITAFFPETSQNHGIERYIVKTYDGHNTKVKIKSVVDENNAPLKWTTYQKDDYLVLRIGDPNKLVHGAQTYKITYTQRDVTKFYKDTNSYEFYWDTNGVDWKIPIQNLTVNLTLDDSIRNSLTGNSSCYFGLLNSKDSCFLIEQNNGFRVNKTDVNPGENITIAVGFNPNTLTEYKTPLSEKLLSIYILLSVLTALISFFIIVLLKISYSKRSNRTKEIGAIIPEYTPPKNATIYISGIILTKLSSIFSAQITDLAVRHYIKITEIRKKALFKSANYKLEIIDDINKLKAEEKEFLSDLFENNTGNGAYIETDNLKKDYMLSARLRDNQKKADTLIKDQYEFRANDEAQSLVFKKRSIKLLIFSLLTLSVPLLIASLTAYVMSKLIKPFTDEGLALKRYLLGVEMYIKFAEQERIKVLQSPEGSAVPIDTNDNARMIKLYERLLPYAILFGQEKEWNKRLGDYYQSNNSQPYWYASSGAFNASEFSNSMSNFSASTVRVNSSYSGSSGGSSGGGFSGGGGGGGGGGGW